MQGPQASSPAGLFFFLTRPRKSGMKSLAMMLMPTTPATPVLPFCPSLPPDPREKAPRAVLSETKLDTCGFAVDRDNICLQPSLTTRFCHGSAHADWVTVAGAMPNIDLNISYATIQNLNGCSTRAWIQFSPSRGKHRVHVKRCGLLVCPTCGPREATKMASRVTQWIGDVKPHAWRMYTISLPSAGSCLMEQIEQLRKAFRRLRQSQVWAETQLYGISVCEVAYNKTADTWHPHLHILMRGKWAPIAAMRTAWWKACGVNARIHVREVDSNKSAAHYVSKYLGKGAKQTIDINGKIEDAPDQSLASMPPPRLLELITARCRKRWLLMVGEGPPLPEWNAENLPDQGANDWMPVCTLSELFRRGKSDPLSQAIAAEIGLDLTSAPP